MGLMAYNSGVLLKLGYLQLPIKYKIVYFDHGNRNKWLTATTEKWYFLILDNGTKIMITATTIYDDGTMIGKVISICRWSRIS